MYTLRHTYMILGSALGLTKSGVRWDAESQNSKSSDLYTLMDQLSKEDNLEKRKDIISKSIQKEEGIMSELLLRARGSEESKYIELANMWEQEYREVKTKLDTEKEKNVMATKNGTKVLKNSVESSDNNDRQAEALLVGLGKIADNNKAAKALFERFDDSKGNTGNSYIKLSSMNIGSMIEWIARGMKGNQFTGFLKDPEVDGYRTNGANNGETNNLFKIQDSLKNSPDKNDIIKLTQTIRSFYDAGQTTEDWMIALTKKPDEVFNKNSFINYLSEYREGTNFDVKFDKNGTGKLETKDRSFMTLYLPRELKTEFSKLTSDADILSRVKELIHIGGQDFSAVSTLADLQKSMYGNPALRAAYVKGLNYVALSNDAIGFFKSGKLEAGINGTQANTLTAKITEASTQEKIKQEVSKAAVTIQRDVANDTKLTPEQKKNISTKIDQLVQTLNSPEKLKTFSVEWAAAVTNRRIGGGASIGTEVNSVLADSVSLTGALSQEFGGNLGGMLAVVLTKEIFASEKAELGVHYGVSYASKLMPFLGLHGRYENMLASITATTVGANIYAGLRTGVNRNESENIQKKISESQEAIRKLAKTTTDLSKIDLTGIVTNPAIADRMTSELKVVLEKNKFNEATSEDAKYMVMSSSIMEVMNVEVLRLSREKNDMGWTLDQFGVNFGQMAGIPYILPGFRIEKGDLQIAFQKITSKIEQKLNTSEQAELLKAMGYTGVEKKFDKDSKKTSFSFLHDVGAARYPITFKTPGTITSENIAKTDTQIDITGHKVAVDMQAGPDGKTLMVNIKDLGPLVTSEVDDTKIENVVLSEAVNANQFESLMQTPSARRALSNLFFVNKSGLSKFLATYKDAPLGGSKGDFLKKIEPDLKSLLSSNRGNKEIGKMYAFFFPAKGKTSNSVDDRFAAINKLRTGLMTDLSNSKDAKEVDGKLLFTAKGGIEKIFNDRKKDPTLLNLTNGSGIDLSDFDSVFAGKTSEKYSAEYKSVNGVDVSKLIGVVAGWKGEKTAHGFNVIPRGMMSIAVDDEGKPLIEEEKDVTKKEKVLFLLMKKQPVYIKQISKSLADQVRKIAGITENKEIDTAELITKGSIVVDGKTINLSAKIYKCAFGECMNFPSYALDLGQVSYGGKKQEIIDGSEITGSRVVTSESIRRLYGLNNNGVNLAVGYESEDKRSRTPDTTETNYRTEIQTREVTIDPKNIKIVSGNMVVPINSGGTSTNIPLSSLTRQQAVAYSNGQSFNITMKVEVKIPVVRVVSGQEFRISNRVSDSLNATVENVISPVTDKDIWDDVKWKNLKEIPAGMHQSQWLDQLIKKGFFDQ